MKESTDRPAWAQTIWQGMGNGLAAFKHRIVHRNNATDIVRDFDWTADANAVEIELKRGD